EARARVGHVVEDAERPHHVEALRAEGPLEHVRLHEVTAGMGAVVGARDVHAAREVDPDRLGPGLVRDVEVAPEAAADVEHELSVERLDGERAAQVAAEVRAPLARELRPRRPVAERYLGEGLEVERAVATRAAEEIQEPPLHVELRAPARRTLSRRSPALRALRLCRAAGTPRGAARGASSCGAASPRRPGRAWRRD